MGLFIKRFRCLNQRGLRVKHTLIMFATLTLAIIMGFVQSKVDSSLFFKQSNNITIYLLVYVDNIIITSSDNSETNNLI